MNFYFFLTQNKTNCHPAVEQPIFTGGKLSALKLGHIHSGFFDFTKPFVTLSSVCKINDKEDVNRVLTS